MATHPAINIISLFSGAGGLDLGLRMAAPAARTVCFVEREAYAVAVLAARMEDGGLDAAPVWSDIGTFDGKPWRGLVDGIVGGFPCQDISNAGKRAGIDGERSGLWSEYVRIIREVGPRFVFVENVAALVVLGLERVLSDLHALGFDAEWGVLAYARCEREHWLQPERIGRRCGAASPCGTGGDVADPGCGGWGTEPVAGERGEDTGRAGERGEEVAYAASQRRHEGRTESARIGELMLPSAAAQWPTPAARDYKGANSPEHKGHWATYLETHPRNAPAITNAESILRGGADGMAPRLDRLRLTGNGVVPQQAALAFRILAARTRER